MDILVGASLIAGGVAVLASKLFDAYMSPKPTQDAEVPTLPVRGEHGRRARSAIFLDFDGVLHPGISETFEYLPAFEALMREFEDVDVVIASSWRESASFAYLTALFSADFRHRIGGVTPLCAGDAARGVEVLAYCLRWGVEQYIAIDDSLGLYPPDCSFLFLTDSMSGLNQDAIRRLRARLSSWSSGRRPEALERS